MENTEVYVKGDPHVQAIIRRWVRAGLFIAGAIMGYAYCWLQMGGVE